jgi:hypothetical protein
MELLHGDAFGEVARLVDVALQLDGEMVGHNARFPGNGKERLTFGPNFRRQTP